MRLSVWDTAKMSDERAYTCELETGDAGQRTVHIQGANMELCMLPADARVGGQLNVVSCAELPTQAVCSGRQEECSVL